MNFEQAAGNDLEWREPERRLHEVSCNGEVVAALRFEKGWGSLATGECGGSRWTFKRTGFLSPRITVRQVGSETDIAVFTPSWSGCGWVVFNSGRRYQLRPLNFWRSEWAFETEAGTPAITLAGPKGMFKHGGTSQVAREVAALPETPVLLMLMWYVRLLMNEDAAAAAVMVACS